MANHSAKRCKYEFSPHSKVKITKSKIRFLAVMSIKASAAPIEIEAADMCYSLIISRESSSIMLLIWTLPPEERFPRLVPYSCSSPAPTEGCLFPLIVRWCRLLWRMLLSAHGHIVTLLHQYQQGVRSACRWWAGWYRCRGGASWDSQAAGVRTCLW